MYRTFVSATAQATHRDCADVNPGTGETRFALSPGNLGIGR